MPTPAEWEALDTEEAPLADYTLPNPPPPLTLPPDPVDANQHSDSLTPEQWEALDFATPESLPKLQPPIISPTKTAPKQPIPTDVANALTYRPGDTAITPPPVTPTTGPRSTIWGGPPLQLSQRQAEAEAAFEKAPIRWVLGELAQPVIQLLPTAGESDAWLNPWSEETMESVQSWVDSKGQVAQAIAGDYEGLAPLVNFFTSPLGAATLGMGGLPLTARKAIAAGFTLWMAKNVPEAAKALWQEVHKPADQMSPQRIAQLIMGGGGSAVFAAHGAREAAPKLTKAGRLGEFLNDITSQEPVRGPTAQQRGEFAWIQDQGPEPTAKPAPGGAVPPGWAPPPEEPGGIKRQLLPPKVPANELPKAEDAAQPEPIAPAIPAAPSVTGAAVTVKGPMETPASESAAIKRYPNEAAARPDAITPKAGDTAPVRFLQVQAGGPHIGWYEPTAPFVAPDNAVYYPHTEGRAKVSSGQLAMWGLKIPDEELAKFKAAGGVEKPKEARPPDLKPNAAQPPVGKPAPPPSPTPSAKPSLPAPKPFFKPEENAELDQLFKRLRKKGGQMSIDVDPEWLTIGSRIGYLYAKAGVRRFSDFASAMIERMGESCKPYLLAWYSAARDAHPQFAKEFDNDEAASKIAHEQFGIASEAEQQAPGARPASKSPAKSGGGGVGPGMGGAIPSELSNPTIEDQIRGELAPPREESPPDQTPTVEPTLSAWQQFVSGPVENFRGWYRGMALHSMPRTTLKDPRLGELGARWASAHIAARPMAEVFAADVLGNSGVNPVEFGAALTEDNLRSVKQAFQEAADKAKNREDAQKFQAKADQVKSFIGSDHFPFATEDAYQKFLKRPEVQEVVKRHIDLWKAQIEPQYRAAMSLDPEIELPSRGLQTGARINLHAAMEGDQGPNIVSSVRRGNLLGTMRRRSPFGVQAKGTGEAYHTDYYDIMANTYGRQLEVANKNAFEDALVAAGQAVVDRPGQQVMIEGQRAVEFPRKRQRIVTREGSGVSQNQSIYINQKLANEYRIAANVDQNPGLTARWSKLMTAPLNKLAITGATDASIHVLNQATTLFTLPGASGKLMRDAALSVIPGRPDFAVAVGRALYKGFKDNRAQLASLAEIGAGRERVQGVDWSKPSTYHHLGGEIIQWMDRSTRLALDDTYQRLAKEGWVENSETARREFVNQVGQYNKRLQGPMRRWARDLGIGPFATAGTTFNVLGARGLLLKPGVRARTPASAMALKANMLAKLVGSLGTVGLLNYMFTHKKGGGVMGRPGTRLGDIDLGTDDKNQRHNVIRVFSMIGPARGFRVTGARGFVEAKRLGLTTGDAADSAARDFINGAFSPFAGPIVHFASVAATGKPPSINVPRTSEVVPPGDSQTKANLKAAILTSSPLSAAAWKATQPGSTGFGSELLKSQLPRFVGVPGMSTEKATDYPRIVSHAQAAEFTDYLIGQARNLPPEERESYLIGQITRMKDPADQKLAVHQIKVRLRGGR